MDPLFGRISDRILCACACISVWRRNSEQENQKGAHMAHPIDIVVFGLAFRASSTNTLFHNKELIL